MEHFSEIIKVDGEELFFVFFRLRTPEDDKFVVTVTKDGATFSVDLKKGQLGLWRMVSPSPTWLKKIEPKLVQAISINKSGG